MRQNHSIVGQTLPNAPTGRWINESALHVCDLEFSCQTAIDHKKLVAAFRGSLQMYLGIPSKSMGWDCFAPDALRPQSQPQYHPQQST